MKNPLLCVALALVLTSTPAAAQTKADEKALRGLPIAFSAAWAKHDGHALASIMAEDVDTGRTRLKVAVSSPSAIGLGEL